MQGMTVIKGYDGHLLNAEYLNKHLNTLTDSNKSKVL